MTSGRGDGDQVSGGGNMIGDCSRKQRDQHIVTQCYTVLHSATLPLSRVTQPRPPDPSWCDAQHNQVTSISSSPDVVGVWIMTDHDQDIFSPPDLITPGCPVTITPLR